MRDKASRAAADEVEEGMAALAGWVLDSGEISFTARGLYAKLVAHDGEQLNLADMKAEGGPAAVQNALRELERIGAVRVNAGGIVVTDDPGN